MDSTFEKLDREIREATAKLLSQEEALRAAVDQLNEDVEGKLDRMELQPLKDYFGKVPSHRGTTVALGYRDWCVNCSTVGLHVCAG